MNLANRFETHLNEVHVFESNRQFELWDYTVSHRQLLLRSPRTGGLADNLDIVFWRVEYLSLPSILNGIAIHVRPIVEDGGIVPADVNETKQLRRFLLGSGEPQYYVVAGGCKVLSNQLSIFDSSLVYTNRDRSIEEYGQVLARASGLADVTPESGSED